MKILGIETSCDETAAAIVEKQSDGKLKLISNVTATSAGIHARTGGVIPEDAARKQIQSIIPVIDLALIDADLTLKEVDAIAVTVGPGLIGSLLVGVETAKTLSYLISKPIVPVNHLVGHLYANWFDEKNIPEFPLLALAVSGGHTDLVYMKDHGKIEYIGGTRDDAAGEAFDKTARLLGFDYPGGYLISKASDEYFKTISKEVKLTLFPRPLLAENNFDFSFSGLKTAVLKEIKKISGAKNNLLLSDYKRISEMPVIKKNKNRLAAEVQEAIVDCLVEKSLLAIKKYKPKSFLLAGGVAANIRLREKLQAGITSLMTGSDSGKVPRVFLHVPKVSLCTDNAAPIAAAAFYNYHPISWDAISANPELTITTKA